MASGRLAFTGVDGQISAVLQSAGANAVVDTTLFARTPTTATISGTEARVELAGDFYSPGPVELVSREGERVRWDDNPIPGHEGLCYQAVESARAIGEGARETTLLTAERDRRDHGDDGRAAPHRRGQLPRGVAVRRTASS